MPRIQYLATCLLIVLVLPCSAQFSTIFDFSGDTTGSYPYYCKLLEVDGQLYGTTANGGAFYDGTIFKINPDGSGFQKLIDFNEETTGSIGESALIYDGEFLYGTARSGGDFNMGTIYKIKPDGSEFSKLHDFIGSDDGINPYGSLFFDGSFLYGMASGGGAGGHGTIYKLKRDGTDFSSILAFDFGTSGNGPNGALISDGTYLYGMATSGGTGLYGTVFKIKPDGSDFSVLTSMSDDPNGAYNYGSLVYDGSYLYGMTNNGGELNRGTIFKISTDGTDYQKLHDFDDTTGAQPLGSLTLVGSTLYGLAELGGEFGKGTMFKLETDGSNFEKLYDFNGLNGELPISTLTNYNGALFGMTNTGGSKSQGVIFKYGEFTSEVTQYEHGKIHMYPNPATEVIHIDPELLVYDKELPVQIINTSGQCVLATAISGSGTISVKSLPSGIYQLIISAGGALYAETFVKQ